MTELVPHSHDCNSLSLSPSYTGQAGPWCSTGGFRLHPTSGNPLALLAASVYHVSSDGLRKCQLRPSLQRNTLLSHARTWSPRWLSVCAHEVASRLLWLAERARWRGAVRCESCGLPQWARVHKLLCLPSERADPSDLRHPCYPCQAATCAQTSDANGQPCVGVRSGRGHQGMQSMEDRLRERGLGLAILYMYNRVTPVHCGHMVPFGVRHADQSLRGSANSACSPSTCTVEHRGGAPWPRHAS